MCMYLVNNKNIEKKAWEMGGKTQKVPAQRLVDFVNGRTSSNLPKTSYQPGITSTDLKNVLPSAVTKALKQALIAAKAAVDEDVAGRTTVALACYAAAVTGLASQEVGRQCLASPGS